MPNKLEVFYYPQCPWIVPTLRAFKAALNEIPVEISYFEHNMLEDEEISKRLEHKGIFVVLVNGRPSSLGIGQIDVDKIRRALMRELGIPTEEGERKTMEEMVREERYSVANVTVNPISNSNLSDVVRLCTKEDFLYGPLPEECVHEADEMRRKWLNFLLTRLNPCGFVAYSNEKALGFIEYVPGDVANSIGMDSVHEADDTCVIVCLSVSPRYWGNGIGEMLVRRGIESLRSLGFRYLEVRANKSSSWHPANFYRKIGFIEHQSQDEKVIMVYEL